MSVSCSEGDRLSGLVVDVFGEHAVVQSSAAWVEKWKGLIQELVMAAAQAASLSWRPSPAMLAEEGIALPPQQQPHEADLEQVAMRLCGRACMCKCVYVYACVGASIRALAGMLFSPRSCTKLLHG